MSAASCGVEVGEALGVGLHRVAERADVEPLGGEAIGEAAGLGVGEHAANLGAEDRFVVELCLVGELGELGVGHRVPEEVGEPRGELVVAEGVDPFGFGFGFDEEEEVGRDEDGLEGELERREVGVAAGLGAVEERHEAREFVVGEGAAEGAAGEGGEGLLGGGAWGESFGGEGEAPAEPF